ncbi:hypothetical protein M426DRAFT_164902 [Hypoxylon sp. CI-4A]|nr:hypothetical protein M426DRAFT_164902 [Hypoxylon sp. CI-4A]
MSGPVTSSPSTSAHPPPRNPSSNPEVPVTIPPAAVGSNNATTSSNMLNIPHISASSQSGSSRPQPSNTASTPRSLATHPTTATATTSASASAAPGTQQPRVTMDLNPTIPSRATQLHINEARAALVASMSNMLDSELQSRAALLHANAAALTRQEKDVAKGTDALRRENDKLEKLARDTERKIKEIGNVQNWAEVLERDFLVLEETMRLVREGSDDDESCSECSGSSRSSWSGSYSADASRMGSRRGSVTGVGEGDAKRSSEEPLTNGNTTKSTGAKEQRDDVQVTVNTAVADSISEAMATNLHEPLDSLSLNTVTFGSQGSSVKGKEPAIEDSGIEFDHVPDVRPYEVAHAPDLSRSDSVEDSNADRNLSTTTTSTATG